MPPAAPKTATLYPSSAVACTTGDLRLADLVLKETDDFLDDDDRWSYHRCCPLIAPLIEEDLVVVSTPLLPRGDDPMILVVVMAFCVIIIFIIF